MKEMNLQKGLVGHWTMDSQDISNGTVCDRSGYKNHGQLKSGITIGTSGVVGESITSDGSGYIPTELFYNTGSLESVSISCWYKSSSSSQQMLVSSDRNEYYRLGVGTDGEDGLQWTVDSSDMVSNTSKSSLQDGVWHHLAVVFDSALSNDHKIYIDNILDSKQSFYNSGIGSGATSYTHIGTGSESSSFDGSLGPDDRLNGSIDDVRIYHRGLSDNEINQLYQMREQRSYNV